MEKHPLHIKNAELQTSAEVTRAVERKQERTEERVPNDPGARIEAYIDRLENIFLNPDERISERNLEMFRNEIYDALIIKREDFPESYFELQKRIARERGEAVEEIPENIREQMRIVAIEDQKASLDAWIDYLVSDDAVYPAWFKYYVWTQITKLSQFDKERGEFKKRTASTVAPFPDIYREPLAKIADLYERVRDNNKDSEARREFDKKFPSLYAEFIQQALGAKIERKEQIQGEWVKFSQYNSEDAERLFESLQGKGTGWCTAGRSTAETQIKSGDFYAYYTYDEEGKPTQPRIAIRMRGKDRIAEVRGILEHQELEPQMQEILDAKLNEFGSEADEFRKKSADMKRLTELDSKVKSDEPLNKEDLVFLYEIQSPIESFGYDKDPRIAELRKKYDTETTARLIFEKTTAIEDKVKASVPLTKEDLAYIYELEDRIQQFPEYSSINDPRIRDIRKQRDLREDARILFEKTTAVENKLISGERLDKDDLRYLYGLDGPIQAFTYAPDWRGARKDPRIEEIMNGRNFYEDAAVILSCTPAEITDDFLKLSREKPVYANRVWCGDRYNNPYDFKKFVSCDFRKPELSNKLDFLLSLATRVEKVNDTIKPDLAMEGGYFEIKVDHKIFNTQESAFEEFKKATNSPVRIHKGTIGDGLSPAPYEAPNGDLLRVVILKYEGGMSEYDDKPTKEIIEDMEKLGLRPLTFSELVVFVTNEPDIVNPGTLPIQDFKNVSGSIIALGTGKLYGDFPQLWMRDGYRELSNCRASDSWRIKSGFPYRFAATLI